MPKRPSRYLASLRAGFEERRPLALAAAFGLAIVLALIVLSMLPTWHVSTFAPRLELGEGSIHWSPDGRHFAFEGPGTFSVISAGGDPVLQGEAGWSPVWLNDQTVATVVDINPTTERLVLLDVPTGKRRPVGGDLAPGRLLADGHGRLAHWHVLDWAASTVLDPADGHVIAGIRGRPLLWLPDGSLIAKTSLALLQGRYLDPGVMMLWKPGSPERVLARGYIEVANSPVLAPSGTAIACICVDISSDRSADSGEVVLRVPLDGSAPDRVAISLSGDFYATAWVDDASILVLNDRWLTRVWVGGKPRPVMIQLPGIEARMVYGRLAAMAGGVAVLVPTETLAKIDPLGHAINNELLVVDHEGRMRLVSLIPSVGGPPPIFAAPDGRHAIILADPQLSLQAPTDMFLLDSP